MTPEQLAELKANVALRQRLAKLMARDCFRNTVLEGFHAGKAPSSQTGDYSDVKVSRRMEKFNGIGFPG